MKEKEYQILTNLNCNLDCSYCYERKNTKMNTFKSAKKYLDFCFEKDKGKVDIAVIDLIGGETFLAINLINQIAEYVEKVYKDYGFKDFELIISTNATLITKNKKIQEFIKKYAKHLRVGVSIDGTKKAHDTYRIYRGSGKGSYDDAVAGFEWLKQHLPIEQTNIKATFSEKTLDEYYDGVVSLFEMGAVDVNANFVFEKVYDMKFAEKLTLILMRLADYLYKTGRYKTHRFLQLCEYGRTPPLFDTNSFAPIKARTQNNCGACSEHMVSLGFDDKLYGCNRFCSMNLPNKEIGIMDENGQVKKVNEAFKQEVINQWTMVPDECKTCALSNLCATCVAAPYENEAGVQDFLDKKGQCGFTYARAVAIRYLETLIKKGENA